MKISCPKSNEIIDIPTGHPPEINIAVTTLCDTLVTRQSILVAGNKLGCCRAYIGRELKALATKPGDYLK